MASDLGVSKNNGTPKSSILIGFSIINHPFWGTTIFGKNHLEDGCQNHFVGIDFEAVNGVWEAKFGYGNH